MDLSLTRRTAISLSTDRPYCVDRLAPWAVHFTGSFGMRWYGLASLAGILAVYLLFVSWAKRGRALAELSDWLPDQWKLQQAAPLLTP